MDAPAIILGEQKLINVQKFPFSFDVEYDESVWKNGIVGDYCIRAEIRNKEKLIYTTDTHFSAIDQKSNKFVTNAEIHVIRVFEFKQV